MSSDKEEIEKNDELAVSWSASSRCMVSLLKLICFIEKLIALTLQVKYLAECIEKLI